MEKEFPNHICLHKGDTITIFFCNKEYKVDIVDVLPHNTYNAINILDTHLNIDFAPPKDLDEFEANERK